MATCAAVLSSAFPRLGVWQVSQSRLEIACCAAVLSRAVPALAFDWSRELVVVSKLGSQQRFSHAFSGLSMVACIAKANCVEKESLHQTFMITEVDCAQEQILCADSGAIWCIWSKNE